jgi:hypothetical protein
MSSASRAFETQRRESLFNQPSANDAGAGAGVSPPWQKIRPNEVPPMMFQLRFRSGEMISFAYSDLREIRVRDAGYVQFGVLGMARMLITIEGRHLMELAECLGSGLIRWMQEEDERETERPETNGAITAIQIEIVKRGKTTQ